MDNYRWGCCVYCRGSALFEWLSMVHPEVCYHQLTDSTCTCISFYFPQARMQALHVAKKFYTKPELSYKIEVCTNVLHVPCILEYPQS